MKKRHPQYVRVSWWRYRAHPVFLISGLTIGVLGGALLAFSVPSEWFSALAWWLVWIGWLGWLFWRQRRWCVVGAVVIGGMIGYHRGAAELTRWVPIHKYTGDSVQLVGTVREDPESGIGSEVRLRLDDAEINGTDYRGTYWVTVAGEGAAKVERSDRITVTGTLEEGFGVFAASMFRARVEEVAKKARFDPMLEVRNTFSAVVRTALPETEAALGVGYLLGQKRALPADFEDALLATGLTHVVVASGYNLTILVRLSRRLFMRVSRYTSAMMSGGMVLAFIGVTGMSASMSRAGLVAGLSLLAWYYGRTLHPGVILLVSAAVSVLIQPSYIWGDVGWMLSFASFAGVMFLAPLLQTYFFGEEKPGVIRQVLGETFAAQLLTLPLVLVTFGVMSNVALLANVLVLPLVPLAMLLTFLVGVAGLLLPAGVELVAQPTFWLLRYMTWIIDQLAQVSWAQFDLKVSVGTAIILYGAILLAIIILKRRTGMSFRRVNLVE